MTVIKVFLKLLALPASLALTLIFWLGVFLVGVPTVFCNLFAGLCALLAVFCYLAGICTGAESIRTLLTGFAVFMLPILATWLLGVIDAVRTVLGDFIRS